MGNNFENDEKYNMTKYIDINIELNKNCFFPGENINGKLNIISKPGTQYSLMTNPQINFTITQLEHYSYSINRGGRGQNNNNRVTYEEEIPLLIKILDFPNIKGESLLYGVKIPFTIQIPLNSLPTLIFNEIAFTKHILTIFIPILQAKKSVLIIIKNSQFFNFNNRLYESPCMRGKSIAKTKCCFFKIGKVNFQLKTPKNSYAYNEIVPFEILIDCNDLNTGIIGVRVSIVRHEKQNLKDNHYKERFKFKKKIFSRFYQFNYSNQKNYQLNSEIKFPNNKNDLSVYPPNIYQICDSHKPSQLYKLIDTMHLAPTSYYGLLSVEYFLKAEIIFETSLTKGEKIKLPIDFYCSDEDFNNNLFEKQKLIGY